MQERFTARKLMLREGQGRAQSTATRAENSVQSILRRGRLLSRVQLGPEAQP